MHYGWGERLPRRLSRGPRGPIRAFPRGSLYDPRASFRGGLLLTFAYRMFMFVELSSPRRLHGPVIVTMSEKEVSRT